MKDLDKLIHDLMNPLTVVVGFAQLLREREDLNKDIQEAIDAIYTHAILSSEIADSIKKIVKSMDVGRQRPKVLIFARMPELTLKVIDTIGENYGCIVCTDNSQAIWALQEQHIDFFILAGVVDSKEVASIVLQLKELQQDLDSKTIVVVEDQDARQRLEQEGWVSIDLVSKLPSIMNKLS